MSCGSQDVAYHLDSAKRQLRPYYYQLPLDKMRCHCCVALSMNMSHTEKNPGRLFFKCSRRICPFFQWVDEDPRGKNRVWLEADKFICLFDGRLVKRSLQDVLCENPLQKGVREIINKHVGDPMGPFEGNWQPDVTPKEQLVLEQRGFVPPSQSDLKDMIQRQVEKEVEWHMYK